MRGFKFPMLEGFRRLGLGVIFDFTARRASEGIKFEGWGGKEWQLLRIARRSQQCLFAQNGESRCAFPHTQNMAVYQLALWKTTADLRFLMQLLPFSINSKLIQVDSQTQEHTLVPKTA